MLGVRMLTLCHSTKSAQSAQSGPSLDTLKQDRFIQNQVDERLKEFSNMAQGTDQNIKSQSCSPVDIFVKNQVKWPHEFVLSGSSKERVSCNNPTLLQWVACFLLYCERGERPGG